MSVESVSLRAERVPPVATDMASSSKSFAAVLLFVCIVLALGVFGMSVEEQKETLGDDSAEAAGAVFGFLLIVGIPGLFGFRHARNASRATRAGKLAQTDPSYTWRLSGKYIIAADGTGAPRPELSFKINSKLRTMLLAVPRAEVVDRS